MTVMVTLLALAALWDMRKGKIPNFLIFIGFSLGLGEFIFDRNYVQLFNCLPGIILPIICFFPLYRVGGLGAGDLKLFSMLGCFLSGEKLYYCIIVSFFIAAFFSLLLTIQRKNLIRRLRYFFSYINDCFSRGRLEPYYPSGEVGVQMKQEGGISLALPILISALFILGGVAI